MIAEYSGYMLNSYQHFLWPDCPRRPSFLIVDISRPLFDNTQNSQGTDFHPSKPHSQKASFSRLRPKVKLSLYRPGKTLKASGVVNYF
jgi:hypothetical protein